MCGPFCTCAVRSAHVRSVLLMCGPFCQRKVLIPIRSSDGKFSSGTFCSLRPVTFMDSLSVSSLQSVPLCSPFRRVCQQKFSLRQKRPLRRTLRWHLSSQKQVSDKEREPVFPDEFSDGEIMTTTRNYFRKSSCAGVYWRKWELFAGGKPASMEHMNYLIEQSAQLIILRLQQVFAIKYCQKNLHTLDSSVI